MTTSTCQTTIVLSRPLHERLVGAVADAWTELRASLRQRAERRRFERELDAVADMNQELLRDIGAPDWLISQAQVRHDADRLRLMEMNMGLPRH